jgi:hypothetical protein
MNDEYAMEQALETLKPFGYRGGNEYDDAVIAAVVKAIKQAFKDGWDYGTR